MKILLINPNTTAATTDRMLAVARQTAAGNASIDAITAPFGAPGITTAKQSAQAGIAVLQVLQKHSHGYDAAIIAAFSDPGLEQARARFSLPIVGIAEAAVLAATEGRRYFSIVTLTTSLDDVVMERLRQYGAADYLVTIHSLPWTIADIQQQPDQYQDYFHRFCQQVIKTDNIQALVIGGGPLASIAAQTPKDNLSVPLYEGVSCAIQRLLY